MPYLQRQGYGKLLIDLSELFVCIQQYVLTMTFPGYLLTRREGKRGTPERPLSTLGLKIC